MSETFTERRQLGLKAKSWLAASALTLSGGLAGCGEGSEPVPSPSQTAATAAPSPTSEKSQGAGDGLYCNGQLDINDYYPEKKGTVVVDGRCDSPDFKDDPTGIYTEPRQNMSPAVAQAMTGAVLEAVRCVDGQNLRNYALEYSDQWVEVKPPKEWGSVSQVKRLTSLNPDETLYIPVVWVNGAKAIEDCDPETSD